MQQALLKRTWDNAKTIRRMVLAQGFAIGADNDPTVPVGATPTTAVPSKLLPGCPNCGWPLTLNMRSDDTFVEDAGWHSAAKRCHAASLHALMHREENEQYS